MASLGMSATDVAPSSGFEVIPPGTEVEMQTTEAEVLPAKSGKGNKLELVFEVVNPEEYRGRKVWESMNIEHENPVAQKIGQERLSALAHACGAIGATDTEELLWKPFPAVLDVETYTKNNGNTGEKNVVKKYLFEQDNAPPESKPAPAPRPAPSTARSTGNGGSAATRPAAGGAPNLPWKRGGN